MDNGTMQMQLPQLEQLCDCLYTSQVPEVRKQAEDYLQVLGQSTEHIPTCKTLLDTSQNPYAQLLASSSLLRMVTEQSVSSMMKLEMRNYFLQYLDTRCGNLEPYVVTSLIQLLCRTTKLGWFENEQQRTIVDSAKQLLERGGQGSPQHYLLGLKILSALVSDMNQQPKRTGKVLQVHRKTAVAFRDRELYKIFQIAITCLRQLKDTLTEQETEKKLKEQSLQLALVCLSFDFVGTCVDECSDEPGTIQIPQAWRPAVEDPTTIEIFHKYYISTTPPLSNMAMECLVRLASVRRSIFQVEAERLKFLDRMLASTTDVLRTQSGLNEIQNYNEFCKLLGRLKANFNLPDLVCSDKYPDWIDLLAHFTRESLTQWRWAGGSVYYLLYLWSRLVTSVPYLKVETPPLLDTKVPDIVSTYIHTRLQSVEDVVQNGITEDPLDDEGQLQEQLDSIPQLCRFKFEDTARILLNMLDPLLQAFQQPPQPQEKQRIAIMEGQLTWMVYIISSIIRGRPTASNEVQDLLDGELSSRVFRLLNILEECYRTGRSEEISRQRLDISLLNFFQNFRKIYVGEQVMMSSKVFMRLGDNVGLKTHNAVLEIMVKKVALNLQMYGSCEDVINATLNLFQELAGGFMSGKLLLGLETITQLLTNHNNDFSFLREPVNFRNRTKFYCTLGKLLFLEDTPAKFKTFVAPLQQVLQGIHAASNNSTDAGALRSNVPQDTVICLFRDLRGIVQATNSRRTYGLVFDWLHPAHFPVITRCLEAWSDQPAVTTPVLKFMMEFVLNKTQRVTFEHSSPNGILLFRQVSEVLMAFGQRVLVQSAGGNDYQNRYKGIWICLNILMRALAGNYVLFGVFELYGDPALNNALDISLKMALSVPLPDIIAYRKISKAYFSLLDVLCHHHIPVVAKCDRPTFSFIMTSLETGLKALEVSVSAQCATAIDNLAAYYFRHVVSAADVGNPPGAAQALADHVRSWPEMFPSMLQTLFETVLFEECPSMWSFSRPMLSLILISDEHFKNMKGEFIRSQPADRQQAVANCLDKLMNGVLYNLEAKNRDKFTQNLTVVRHEFKGRNMV
ncbi:hypothetical protein BSKO_10767 [Bryopsis sp. KO-2023]|nr:hypothetical protein BSKO_10767 [Bryopsis sp. KO-2023]